MVESIAQNTSSSTSPLPPYPFVPSAFFVKIAPGSGKGDDSGQRGGWGNVPAPQSSLSSPSPPTLVRGSQNDNIFGSGPDTEGAGEGREWGVGNEPFVMFRTPDLDVRDEGRRRSKGRKPYVWRCCTNALCFIAK